MGSLSWAGGHFHCTGVRRSLLHLHICTGCCMMAGKPRPPDKKRRLAHIPALPDLAVRDTKYRAQQNTLSNKKRWNACAQICMCTKKNHLLRSLHKSINANNGLGDNRGLDQIWLVNQVWFMLCNSSSDRCTSCYSAFRWTFLTDTWHFWM